MKLISIKFHQPICLGTNYVSHIVTDDTCSIDWSNGIATIDKSGIKELYHVLSGNIESFKTSREEFDNRPKMGRPKKESE